MAFQTSAREQQQRWQQAIKAHNLEHGGSLPAGPNVLYGLYTLAETRPYVAALASLRRVAVSAGFDWGLNWLQACVQHAHILFHLPAAHGQDMHAARRWAYLSLLCFVRVSYDGIAGSFSRWRCRCAGCCGGLGPWGALTEDDRNILHDLRGSVEDPVCKGTTAWAYILELENVQWLQHALSQPVETAREL